MLTFFSNQGEAFNPEKNTPARLLRQTKWIYLLTYLKEIAILTCGMLIAAAISSGIFYLVMRFVIENSIERTDMLVFGGIMLCYAGFLYTIFNVLFLPHRMTAVNVLGLVRERVFLSSSTHCRVFPHTQAKSMVK